MGYLRRIILPSRIESRCIIEIFAKLEESIDHEEGHLKLTVVRVKGRYILDSHPPKLCLVKITDQVYTTNVTVDRHGGFTPDGGRSRFKIHSFMYLEIRENNKIRIYKKEKGDWIRHSTFSISSILVREME